MPRLPLRQLRRAALALACLAGVACDDPFQIEPQFDTVEKVVTLRALTGTPLELPAALLVAPEPQIVRPSSEFIFDLAFDFDETGAAQLYPVDVIARPSVVGGRTVGLQKITGQSYEQVTRAPAGGYTFRQALPVAVGDVVVVQSVGQPSCAASFTSSVVFAKFRVEAINPADRTLTLRMLTDPNCGFRGFESGKPSR